MSAVASSTLLRFATGRTCLRFATESALRCFLSERSLFRFCHCHLLSWLFGASGFGQLRQGLCRCRRSRLQRDAPFLVLLPNGPFFVFLPKGPFFVFLPKGPFFVLPPKGPFFFPA